MNGKKENSSGKKNTVLLSDLVSAAPAAVFLVILFATMIFSFRGNVKEAFAEAFSSADGFAAASDNVEAVLKDNISGRNTYLNVDGFAARILRIDNLNGCQIMGTGNLAMFEDIVDTSGPAESVIGLKEFLDERDIPFLYVLAPSSASIYDADYLPGHGNDSRANIKNMTDTLNKCEISALDMDSWFEENGWTTNDVFFKTDHHWTPHAALAAACRTMEYLEDSGYADYNREWLDEDSWDITVYPDLMLGSYGARTGAWYVGTDDLPVYLPKFQTDYTYSCLEGGTTWYYHDGIADLSYTLKKDYFNSNPYYVYMYGDYSFRKTENACGWNDKKLLLTGDSFKMPFEYFLTTQFKEVYTIDTRYYSEDSLAEFILDIDPDIVIMCTYEGSFTDERLYAFGTAELIAELEETEKPLYDPISVPDISIPASDIDDAFAVIYKDPEPGNYYTLTLNGADSSGGKDRFIQMAVYDLTDGHIYRSRYFESGLDEGQKWIFKIPEDPDGEYEIRLYDGISGNTAGNSVSITGIVLSKGIWE